MRFWSAALFATLVLPVLAFAGEIPTTYSYGTPGVTKFIIGADRAVDDFTEAIPICPETTISWSKAGSAVVSLYTTTYLDRTAAKIESGTLVEQFTQSTSSPFILNTSAQMARFVVDTAETSGTASELTITCNQRAMGAGGGQVSQPQPPDGSSNTGTTAHITTPADVNAGWGFTWSSAVPGFTASRYPGGPAGDGSEHNNQLGWYYNRNGVGGNTNPNIFEYGCDFSWESAYRDTTFTQDQTWGELNWDCFPPDLSSPMTASTGSFLAGDVVEFSNGGTGRVLSTSGSNPTLTLFWRHDHDRTSTGETVNNLTRSGTGILGAITWNGASNNLRPFIMVYRTLDHTASHSWCTGIGECPFNVGAGYARHNGNIIVAGTGLNTRGPAYWAISDGGAVSRGTEVCSATKVGMTCVDVLDAGDMAETVAVDCTTDFPSGTKFIALCK